jgi:hypothetical protein
LAWKPGGGQFQQPARQPGQSGVLHSHKTDGIGLFTGQIGYAWNSAILRKGGAAVTSNRILENVFGTELASASSTAGAHRRWI